jgi:hypothetical protein
MSTKDLVRWKRFLADAQNLPADKPGAYAIWNAITGGIYIGISENVYRRLRAHSGGASPTRLRRAFAKYGKSSFVVIPLFYLTNHDADFLVQLESGLIIEYQAITRGYNIKVTHGSVGPFGAMFSASIQRTWTVDRRRQQSNIARAQWDSHEGRSRKQSGISAAFSRPEVRQNQSVAAIARYASPIERTKSSAMAKEINARPGMKERKSEKLSVLMWVTNGEINKRVPYSSTIPLGWRLGMRRRNTMGATHFGN